VLTAIIFRVRAGKATLPLVSAYDVFEQTWSPPMPYLFQRRFGTEDRPLTRSYIRECLVATSQAAQIAAAGQPLQWRPHDFRRIFVTDAIRSGLPPYIAAKVCGHSTVDTTMGYAAIYPEDVIAHHRAFIARRRAERPSEEYRDLTAQEWDAFLAHFQLRKVALGTCDRPYGTPCQHEHACLTEMILRSRLATVVGPPEVATDRHVGKLLDPCCPGVSRREFDECSESRRQIEDHSAAWRSPWVVQVASSWRIRSRTVGSGSIMLACCSAAMTWSGMVSGGQAVRARMAMLRLRMVGLANAILISDQPLPGWASRRLTIRSRMWCGWSARSPTSTVGPVARRSRGSSWWASTRTSSMSSVSACQR
jgi:Phage integrase family